MSSSSAKHPLPPFLRYDQERFYADAKRFAENGTTTTMHEFPSIFDKPSLSLSVIIPAKDEENRLPIMLDECIAHLTVKLIIFLQKTR